MDDEGGHVVFDASSGRARERERERSSSCKNSTRLDSRILLHSPLQESLLQEPQSTAAELENPCKGNLRSSSRR